VRKSKIWLIAFAIEPRFARDAERLVLAFATMASEDVTFGYIYNPETRELIVKGVDEHCPKMTTDALKRRFNVEVILTAPQVAYRETVARSSDIDYTHKKQTGGTGQFAASS
jgi:elongation factor G